MTKRVSQIKYTGGSNEAGSTCQRCAEPDRMPEDRPVKIRAAVFFDGTLNNRTNTGLGEKGIIKGDSYKNALTNIAILEHYYDKNTNYDYSYSVYIEGVGTADEESDRPIVAGLGLGPTGILDKVELGFAKVAAGIDSLLKAGQEIECLDLDCFGFSRGAAAARNFIYSALLRSNDTLKLRLQFQGHSVSEINVKFVGLFDTVAAYGLNPENDTEELHLDAIRHAEYVLQLAAAEEHRRHFPLTNINSAPHGLQLFLPGAHSDIGGGYIDNMNEEDHQILVFHRRYGITPADKAALAREREWLLESGWYSEDEIQDINIWDGAVKVNRRAISNDFHRIPLKMMAQHATEKGVNFSPEFPKKYRIPPSLEEVEAFILSSPLSTPKHWLDSKTEMIKKLRHDYLHFSACFGSIVGCNDPQFTDDDPVHGRRKREIKNG